MKFFKGRGEGKVHSLDSDIAIIKGALDYGDGSLVENFTSTEFRIFLWGVFITERVKLGPQLICDEVNGIAKDYENFMGEGHKDYIKKLAYLIKINNIEFGGANRITNVTEPLYLVMTFKKLGVIDKEFFDLMGRADLSAHKSDNYENFWSNFIFNYESLTDFLKFAQQYDAPKEYDEYLYELYFQSLINPSVYGS